MTDDLAPFFETRETRTGRLPEEARGKFELAEKQAIANGQTDFADRQFVSLWLSRRTGMPRKDIMANFDAIASRYFGDGATASAAWDRIAANYKSAGAGEKEGQPEQAADAEYANVDGLPKVGADALLENMEQSGRAMAGGFEGFAQKVPGGLYSQAAAATGPALIDPREDPAYKSAFWQNRELEFDPSPMGEIGRTRGPMLTFQLKRTSPEAARLLFTPEGRADLPARIEENRRAMADIVRKADDENRKRIKEWAQSTKGEISQEYRRLASFWYDLSEGAMDRWGVDTEFQNTTLGQFMQSAGSVPATAALAVMGPGGWVGMESAFFADVEQERMKEEGANYDAQKALLPNLTSALPQLVMEKAFGVERLMTKVLGEMPKMAGKVTFGDFAKQFVRRGLSAGVEEGITEPAQGFWNDYIASLTYDEQRETLTGEAAKRRLVESVSGFALGFVFGGGITTLEAVDQNRAVKKGAQYLTTKDGQPLTPEDFRVLRQVKSDTDLMGSAPDEESGRLLIAAANGDASAQNAYNQRVLNTLFVNTDGVEVNGLALGTVNNVPVVRMADGMILPLDMTQDQDRAFVDSFKREAVRQQALNETTEFLKKGLEAGRSIEVSDKERTLQDFINESKIDVDEAAKRIGIATDVNGAEIPEGTNPADVRVLGANVAEYQAGVYRDVSHIYQGGNALTAIEEVAEGYVKKRLAVGDLFEDELAAWRAKYEADTGTKTETAGTVSNIEWFSKRAVDYAVANRKQDGMPKTWGAFLRTLGEHLKTVIRLAERLKKLKRDGKLDSEFEAALKGALGMIAPDEAFAAIRQRDAARMEQGNRETAPNASDVDLEMMDEAQASDTFPKITGNEGDGFTVTAPDGEEIGTAQTMDDAQNQALKWYDDQARAEEREAALDAAGLSDADNELQNVILKRGGLLAPSKEPVFGGAARGADRFRYDAETKTAKWTNGPSAETRNIVENYLERRGAKVVRHVTNAGESIDDIITFATSGIPQNNQQALAAQAAALMAKKQAATSTLIARINAGMPLPQRAKLVRRTTQASIISKLAMPVTARLQRINPELAQRLRRFEFDLGNAISRDFQACEAFMKGFEQMKKGDAAILDLALKNGDTQRRDWVLQKYNLQQEFLSVEITLEQARARGIAAGYEVGKIQDYFPRKVNDLDGLRAFYNLSPKGGQIEEAIREAEKEAQSQGQTLSREERIEIVNSVLQRFHRPPSKPGNFKTRKIDVVEPDADKFYASSIEALVTYIETVNKAVERRRFFGNYAVEMQAPNGGKYISKRLALEASIGAYVEEMIATGKMSRAQQDEVQSILVARFDQGVVSQFVKNFKALSYLGTMGQITSAMTQVTDLAFSLYENGVYDTIVSAGKAVVRQSNITRKGLGLDGIAEEFRDVGKLHRILDLTFKAVGIHYLDLVGKETLVNAKFRVMQREAKAGKLSARSRDIINTSFEPAQAQQVIADLAAGKQTPDTLFAVYTVLADFQPISMSEYPEAYLRHPNGRVFYMLKTFVLKQIEAFRRESFSLIVNGNAKQKAVGFRNLIHLAGLLYIVGLPLDWLKDWIMARDPQLSDLAVDNLFKLLGVNRWNLWQFRYRKNPLEAAMLLVVPPAPFLQYPLLDAENIAKKISEGDDIEPGQFESWRMLPFVGAPIYWYQGGGATKIEERRKKRDARGRIGER